MPIIEGITPWKDDPQIRWTSTPTGQFFMGEISVPNIMTWIFAGLPIEKCKQHEQLTAHRIPFYI